MVCAAVDALRLMVLQAQVRQTEALPTVGRYLSPRKYLECRLVLFLMVNRVLLGHKCPSLWFPNNISLISLHRLFHLVNPPRQ